MKEVIQGDTYDEIVANLAKRPPSTGYYLRDTNPEQFVYVGAFEGKEKDGLGNDTLRFSYGYFYIDEGTTIEVLTGKEKKKATLIRTISRDPFFEQGEFPTDMRKESINSHTAPFSDLNSDSNSNSNTNTNEGSRKGGSRKNRKSTKSKAKSKSRSTRKSSRK